MEVVSALVVFVCVLLLEGGGASRWRPRPDVSVSESKTAELIVGQRLRVNRVWSFKATGRRGVRPEHFQGGLPAGPIGRLTGGQIYQSEKLPTYQGIQVTQKQRFQLKDTFMHSLALLG